MSKITLIIITWTISISILSQNTFTITKKHHVYQPGDNIIKQQVEFKDPGPSGRNITWDFSSLNTLNYKYPIRYFLRSKSDSSRIVVSEHDTRYRYLLQNDTLWLYEYQNKTTKMTFTRPEAQLKFPFNYGDSLISIFDGTGSYCDEVNLTAKGKTTTTVDAIGKLITPSFRTFENVLRVHRIRQYAEIGIDSALLNLETYSWYANNQRYPVFETFISNIIKNDSILNNFKTSFYYPTDEHNIQNELTDFRTEAEKVLTEAQLMPNPVVSTLNISYKLTRPAQIRFSLHNNIGVPVRQTSTQNMPEGFNNTSINMSNLITGAYTLYIFVDDLVMQKVVVKK